MSVRGSPTGHSTAVVAAGGDQHGRVSHTPYGECLSCRGLSVRSPGVTATLIGYARCSTDKQDVEAQRQTLLGLGVAGERIYLDRGLTGTHRRRPGLDQALAAVGA